MNRLNSNIEIIDEMLQVGKNNAGITEHIYSSNMSHYKLLRFLGFLLAHGLIDRLAIDNLRFSYRVTEKGLTVVKNIENIIEALEFKGK